MHPWGKPSQGKNPRWPERCSVDEAIAPFHGLQPGCVPGSSRGCRKKEVLWAVCVLQRSVVQRLSYEKGSEPLEARASKLGATEGPEMSSGRMPQVSSGQPGLQKSVVREVEGRRARIVEGSRSRNVEVGRSHRYHKGKGARRRCQELAELSVVGDTCHEERSTL
ncbi:hypothetical protein FOXYSP1_20866 [Fusarium oxysporum f. sp. phaseoli]